MMVLIVDDGHDEDVTEDGDNHDDGQFKHPHHDGQDDGDGTEHDVGCYDADDGGRFDDV